MALGGTRLMLEPFDEPERKLAAIMAADVVGFSRMMGEDERGTLAGLARVRQLVFDPMVASHRGRIFKVMGDGLLTEFPSSMLALRAAIAIQTRLADHDAAASPGPTILLRIGIHQGDVLVHGEDLLGDGVNIAARLEPLAPHGGICISARVREDAIGKATLSFEDGGERMLKNIARPMRVFFLRPDTTPKTEIGRSVQADDPGERTMVVPVSSRRHSLIIVDSASSSLTPGHTVLIGEALTLGRLPPSDLMLPSGEVSRMHCRVDVAHGKAVITDLRSTNGTFVNDRRIEKPTALAPGAMVKVGPYQIRYGLDLGTADDDLTHIIRA